MDDRTTPDPGSKESRAARYSLFVLYAACALATLAIFVLDMLFPAGVALGVLYAAVILLSLWLPHEKATLGLATISSILILGAFFYKPAVEDMWKVVFNRSIALFIVWMIASLGLKRKRLAEQRNAMLLEREKTLREMKILRGLLPICASCKKIRDDKGYWTQIEGYIRAHSEAEFTHGICPECAKRLYPEVFGKAGSPRQE